MVNPALTTTPAPSLGPRGQEPGPVWQRVLSRLQRQTAQAHYETYLRGTRGLAYDPGASVIRVADANPFHVPRLEGKLSPVIHTTVAEIVGAPVRVEFCSAAETHPPAS